MNPARIRPARVAALSLLAFLSAALAPSLASGEVCGSWQIVEPPAGATRSASEVRARSSTEAYAFVFSLGLIRWDGATWSPMAVPIEDVEEYSTVWIERIGVIGSDHLFLAGRGETGPFSNDQVLMFWDGQAWDHATLTLQPDIMGAPRNGAPSAVVGTAPDDVWIVGLTDALGDGINGRPILTVHWDGSTLTEYMTPGIGNRQNNIYDADAISSDDAWAVGDYNNTNNGDDNVFHGATYHWDGTEWSVVPNPTQSLPSTHLNAVAAIASDDVWAAGDGLDGPIFMHWDGSDWTIVPSPAPTGTVQELAALSSNDVWAVDSPWQVPLMSKYYHWDGTSWSVVTPPDVPGAFAVSRHGGLAAGGECDVWSVGSMQIGSTLYPYMEHLESDGSVVSVPDVAPQVAWLEVAPNPAFASARIRLALPDGSAAHVRIYDSRGRLSRDLGTTAGAGAVRWDTRDDAGRKVADGIYFVRAESNGQIVTEKLTVIR